MRLGVVLSAGATVVLALVLNGVTRSPSVVAQAPPSTSLYVSPSGSDRSSCSQHAPCQTFGRAYSMAKPGQTVYIMSGTYPPQTITQAQGKGTTGDQPDVTFEPAPGAYVRVPRLSLGDSLTSFHGPTNLTIKNVSGGDSADGCGWDMLAGANEVTWDHVQACYFYVNGVTHVTIRNSTFGGCTQTTIENPSCTYSTVDANPINDDIVLQGDTFHDYRTGRGATDVHMQCLFVGGALNLVISNSRFFNCDVFDIFLQYGSSVAAARFDGLRIENNWFAPALTGEGSPRPTAVWFSARGYRFENVTVRSNSFAESSLGFDGDGPDPTNFNVTQNILDATSCLAGVSFTDNIWATRDHCGGAEISQPPLGYRIDNGRLALVQPDVRAVRRIFTLCARGVPPVAIVSDLTMNPLLRNVQHWRLDSIREISSNTAYLGGFAGAKGASPPLTWQAQFDKAEDNCGA